MADRRRREQPRGSAERRRRLGCRRRRPASGVHAPARVVQNDCARSRDGGSDAGAACVPPAQLCDAVSAVQPTREHVWQRVREVVLCSHCLFLRLRSLWLCALRCFSLCHARHVVAQLSPSACPLHDRELLGPGGQFSRHFCSQRGLHLPCLEDVV
eukprot:Amastigsp_a339619_18.p3 type:complete len:156 gc:universal Amastigsp_a339619_18:592-125(-)